MIFGVGTAFDFWMTLSNYRYSGVRRGSHGLSPGNSLL
jgi:hypothetical protein